MKLITGPRGSGKTTRAVQLANGLNAHLAVRNNKLRETIERRREEDPEPCVKHRVFTHDEIRRHKHLGTHPDQIVIDDVERFVNVVVGSPVMAATLTPDGQEELDGGLDD